MCYYCFRSCLIASQQCLRKLTISAFVQSSRAGVNSSNTSPIHLTLHPKILPIPQDEEGVHDIIAAVDFFLEVQDVNATTAGSMSVGGSYVKNYACLVF